MTCTSVGSDYCQVALSLAPATVVRVRTEYVRLLVRVHAKMYVSARTNVYMFTCAVCVCVCVCVCVLSARTSFR